MSPRHHPAESLIASCMAGTLRPGAALVVRAHLATCDRCRQTGGFFESLGGALLEAEPAAELSPGALDRALEAIEAPRPPPAEAVRPSRDAAARALPASLDGLKVRRRRWIAPGVSVTPIETERRSRELVYLLSIGPGMLLPRHTHAGCEFTAVLQGRFSDDTGVYEAGDFIATDEAVEHSPVVAREGVCICLVSTDARLVMRDFVGRLFQPFAAI